MLNRLRQIIVGVVLLQGTLVMAGETSLPQEVQRIGDPRIEESEAMRLIERLRVSQPTDAEAKLFAQIANSNKYSNTRRRRAVFQLFDRHVHVGMRVGELGKLLGTPSWLKKENVVAVRNVGGVIPLDDLLGETVFVIVPELPPKDLSSGVYLRVEGGRLSGESMYDALLEKKSQAAKAKITAVVVRVSSPDDQKLLDSQGAVKGGP